MRVAYTSPPGAGERLGEGDALFQMLRSESAERTPDGQMVR